MKRLLLSVLMSVAVVSLLGCVYPPAPKAAEGGAEPREVKPAEPPALPVVNEPSAWVKGDVFRVWPYGNGELMAYVGTKDGLRNGNVVILSRDGVTINMVEVIDAQEQIFYGRVVHRDTDEPMAQLGDVIILPPRLPGAAPPQTEMNPTEGPARE